MKTAISAIYALSILTSVTAFGLTKNPGACTQEQEWAGCQTYFRELHEGSETDCLCPDPVPPQGQGPTQMECHGMSYPYYDQALGQWTCIPFR